MIKLNFWPFKNRENQPPAAPYCPVKERQDDAIKRAENLLEELKRELSSRDRERSAYIFAFSQVETRLQLLEALKGVRFEPCNKQDLECAGSGRHVAIDKNRLKSLLKEFNRQWKLIDKTARFTRIGIRK